MKCFGIKSRTQTSLICLKFFLMEQSARSGASVHQLEIEYQENLKTFKPGFPTMVQLRAKIEEIDRQLARPA